MILVNLKMQVSHNGPDKIPMQVRETYSAVRYVVSGLSDIIGIA
jgi:hypothetical protein